MEPKDWIGVVLTVWSNIIATIALIVSIKDKKDKKKTASKSERRKNKR